MEADASGHAPAAVAAAAPAPEEIEWVTHQVVINPGPPPDVAVFRLPARYASPIHISAGTYGTVVAATDSRTGRRVAIKKMFDPWRTPLHGKRTYRELRLLRYMHDAWPTAAPKAEEIEGETPSFQHQQIVALLDAFVASTAPGEESLYLVMEHGGIDLSKIYKEVDDLSDAHVKFFAYSILRALVFLHSAGIVHRDLKPSNIAVDPEASDVKLLDFGLSRTEPGGKMTGYVATRYYRAPEVILTWEQYGAPIDMWSFGCIFAEMMMRGRSHTLIRGRDYLDQLRRIGKMLGRPDADTLARLGGKQQRWVLENVLEDAERIDFTRDPRWAPPGAPPPDPDGIDLIQRLLVWNPDERLTAEQAIAHPYFGPVGDPDDGGHLGLHDPADEPKAVLELDDAFETWELDAGGWRDRIIEEVRIFKDLFHGP